MAADEKLFLKVLGTLNEAQARWYVAREAIAQGRGGLKAVHQLTGTSRPTILRGIREVRAGRLRSVSERIRAPGGGRSRIEEHHPAVVQALERIMRETTAGDPMSLLRWTCKSTETIAAELRRQHHRISADTVGQRLHALGHSLQSKSEDQGGTVGTRTGRAVSLHQPPGPALGGSRAARALVVLWYYQEQVVM
jgi:hypothetical protein